MNVRDSEIVAQLLTQQGYRPAPEISEANLIVLNTCAIRAKAEQKMFSFLGSLRTHKEKHPDVKICVLGCVAQQLGDTITKRMAHVDLVVGTQQLYQLPSLLEDPRSRVAVELLEDFAIPEIVSPETEPDHPSTQPPSASRFVTIMQGCNNFCAYCVVPYTRGREQSRAKEDIIDEIEQHVARGVKEITLLGQNVNSYGSTNPVTADGSPYSFAHLVRDVAKIPGLRRIRFTTSHPKDLSPELIQCFAELPTLCPHLHLPVQSGSNRILTLMNRRYRREAYLALVETLKIARPDIAITTDIIVGFPGETETDFADTMALLESARFHGSFSFKYSDRAGTSAQSMPDKVEETIKAERLRTFQHRQEKISLEHNQSYIDHIIEVMVESSRQDSLMGRTGTNHIVHIAPTDTQFSPGELVNVRITHAGPHALRGAVAPAHS